MIWVVVNLADAENSFIAGSLNRVKNDFINVTDCALECSRRCNLDSRFSAQLSFRFVFTLYSKPMYTLWICK